VLIVVFAQTVAAMDPDTADALPVLPVTLPERVTSVSPLGHLLFERMS